MSWPGPVPDVMTAVPNVHSVRPQTLFTRLSAVAVRGLAEMYEPRSRSFPRTLRGHSGDRPLVAEGMSVRYTAIAALGLSRLDEGSRRDVLRGRDVDELLPGILGLALAGRDPGAIALAVWTAVELAAAVGPDVLPAEQERLGRAVDRLLANISTEAPVPTVDHAWTLVALLAVGRSRVLAELGGGAEHVAEATHRAAERLLSAQAPSGLFPHHLPVDRLGRFRSHVSCFADQVYPVQALTRYAAALDDAGALDAAGRCADRIAALQGDQGQWWWHYDWRHGAVVERYPVYSVHQHAMAPMALMELWGAGGADHRSAVAAGVGWLLERPESASELIADDLGVVWRKVGRRDPRKAVRKVRSAMSARRPAARFSWLDRVFPPGRLDRECRPFELGWLLYAWHARQPQPAQQPLVATGETPAPRFVVMPRAVQPAGERS